MGTCLGRVRSDPETAQMVAHPVNRLVETLLQCVLRLPTPETLSQGRAGEKPLDFAGCRS